MSDGAQVINRDGTLAIFGANGKCCCSSDVGYCCCDGDCISSTPEMCSKVGGEFYEDFSSCQENCFSCYYDSECNIVSSDDPNAIGSVPNCDPCELNFCGYCAPGLSTGGTFSRTLTVNEPTDSEFYSVCNHVELQSTRLRTHVAGTVGRVSITIGSSYSCITPSINVQVRTITGIGVPAPVGTQVELSAFDVQNIIPSVSFTQSAFGVGRPGDPFEATLEQTIDSITYSDFTTEDGINCRRDITFTSTVRLHYEQRDQDTGDVVIISNGPPVVNVVTINDCFSGKGVTGLINWDNNETSGSITTHEVTGEIITKPFVQTEPTCLSQAASVLTPPSSNLGLGPKG